MENSEQRTYFEQLASRGQLTAAGLEFALRRLGCLPDQAAWRSFADRGLLALGCLLLLSGVVFFFAFNWQDLHRFAKLGLVAAGLAGCAVVAARIGVERDIGKACLAGAAVLTGVLLAVAGQIYQSGADSELLFFAWAILILPWVLAGRLPWLWLFWAFLGNVALVLYIEGRMGVWGLFAMADGLYWSPLLLNAAFLVAWEAAWPRFEWLRASYGPRILTVLCGIYATSLGVSWWWLRDSDEWHWLHYTPILYLTWCLGGLAYYQRRRHDIVPLAVAALSGICVITAGMVKEFRFFHALGIDSLLIAVSIGGLSAGAAVWLRRTQASWGASQ